MGYSTVDETTAILWDTLHSREIISELYKHNIKRHPSITSTFVRFLITANISDPLQEIYQIKRDIKVLSTNSELHCGSLTKLKEQVEPGGRVLGKPSKLASTLLNLVI